MTAHRSDPVESHFRCLDGLRGIAILLVVATHTTTLPVPTGLVSHIVYNFIKDCGMNGVTLFFALSGFLVSLPFWRLRAREAETLMPRDYAWRRFIKIYPPLVLTLLVFYPIYTFLKPHAHYAWTLIAWLTGLAIFVPVNGDINGVMWTLVAEIQYYLVLPGVMLALASVPIRFSLWIIPAVFFLGGVVARWGFHAFGVSDLLLGPILYVPPLVHLDAFSMGVLVAGLYATGKLGRTTAVIGQLACVGSLALMLILAYPTLYAICATMPSWGHEVSVFLKICFFGSSLFILADPKCFFARILSHPLLCWFGLISYEWYLIHCAVYLWIRDAVGATHGNAFVHIAMQMSAIALGLVLAALTYYLFSAPLLRWGKKTATRRSSPIEVGQTT